MDDAVSGSDGWAEFPLAHQEGEVPWGDKSDDSIWLSSGVEVLVGGSVTVGFSGDFVGPTSVVSDVVDDFLAIGFGHGEGFSVVEGFQSDDLIEVVLDQLGEFHHHLTSVSDGGVFPSWEGGFGGGDGQLDVFSGGLGNFADGFFGSGIDDLDFFVL